MFAHTGRPILILAPHTDDESLGCGGTMARLVDEGWDVHAAAFSPGRAFDDEFDQATFLLGVTSKTLYHYPNKEFEQNRQDILENMMALNRLMNPGAVFVPSTGDTHQDHAVITREAMRVFKERVSIFGFESLRNNPSFNGRCFIPLEEKHVEKKVEAIQAYRSQEGKLYTSPELVRSLARVRGLQAGTEFAEAFEVIKCVL